MGKSLRSKKQQTNKRIKRATNYGLVENERALRLAEKLHGASSEQLDALKRKVEKIKGTEAMEDETEEPKAETPTQPVKKVSTSGWKTKKPHLSKRKKTKKHHK